MTTRNILLIEFLILVQNHLGSCSQIWNSPQGGGNAFGDLSYSSEEIATQTETAMLFDFVGNGTRICAAMDVEDDPEHITPTNLPTQSTLQDDATECSGEDDEDYDYTKIANQYPNQQQTVSTSNGFTSKDPILRALMVACEDTSPYCEFWAESGECQANPTYMHQSCGKSCGKCNSDLDNNSVDLTLAEDMGVAQVLTNEHYYVAKEASIQRIAQSRQYMLDGMRENPTLYAGCRNVHPDCIGWAVAGECVTNAPFMKTECAPSCFSCEYSTVRAYRDRVSDNARANRKKGSRGAGRSSRERQFSASRSA